jgi:hypothetical protein
MRCLLLAAAASLLMASSASADRAFSPRYATNDNGAIAVAANTLMSCAASTNCTTARSEPLTGTAWDNQDFNMTFVDIDSDSSTSNSSSADLDLPSGATVLYAGLYWSARSSSTTRNTIKFKAPGDGSYTSLTASVLDVSNLGNGFYQGISNVTSRV